LIFVEVFYPTRLDDFPDLLEVIYNAVMSAPWRPTVSGS